MGTDESKMMAGSGEDEEEEDGELENTVPLRALEGSRPRLLNDCARGRLRWIHVQVISLSVQLSRT